MKIRVVFGAISAALLSILLFVSVKKVFWQEHEVASLETRVDIPETTSIVSEEKPLLNHLACIMDGNRRWARKNDLKPWEGHKVGIEVARSVVEFCIEKNIKYLSLYTLSPENFRRSAEEINYIFELMAKEAQKGTDEFIKNGIRVRFLGDRSLFPKELLPMLEQIEKETAHCSTLNLTFLFCYGGRQEIASAVKNIAQKVKDGILKEDDITPELVSKHLWTGEIPDPDLIIRTGYVSRLSNFLLYQAAYSELYMLDCFWPEFTKEHLEEAYNAFSKSERRFGA